MWVQFLGWEDPLEEGMATHSSILAWGIPWTEEPGGLQPIGLQRIRHDREVAGRSQPYPRPGPVAMRSNWKSGGCAGTGRARGTIPC